MAIEYGLLGRKLSHSYSPAIHALLANYRYELIEAEIDDARKLIASRSYRGLNVTIPYKKDAYALCDKLSEDARLTGAVNTIVNESGVLTGHNTDIDGFRSMLARGGLALAGKKAAVLGGGGSGQMAMAALAGLTVNAVLVSRAGPIDYESLYRNHADVQILINATPVGMYPNTDASPVTLSSLPNLEAAFDLIYNPCRTSLLLDAEERGLPTQNGLWMLIAQARRGAELFTQTEIDEKEIARVFRAMRAQTENVVLIGMPGCGKSSVGRALAGRMSRAFVDIDEEIVKRAGRPIPEIFEKEGEAAFRELEAKLIKQYAKERALVIATGGGAVLRQDNMRNLRQNGAVFFIDRPIDDLATDGRPLSLNKDALAHMENERLPLYKRYSSKTIPNARDIEGCARAVEEGFYEAIGD